MDLVNKKSKKRLGGMLEGRFNKRKRRKQKRGSVSNDSEPRVKEIQPPGTYTDNACFDSFVENQFGRKNSQSLIRLMELAKASKTTTDEPIGTSARSDNENMATPSRRRSRGHIGKAGRRVLNITHKKTKYQDMINRRSSFKIPTYRDDPQPDFDSSEEEQGGVDDNNSYQSHSTTTANTYEKPRRKERLGGMLNKKKRNQYITKQPPINSLPINITDVERQLLEQQSKLQQSTKGPKKPETQDIRDMIFHLRSLFLREMKRMDIIRERNAWEECKTDDRSAEGGENIESEEIQTEKSYESEFQPDFPLREGGKKQNNVELDAFGRPVRKRKNHVHLQ
eukprot:UN22701